LKFSAATPHIGFEERRWLMGKRFWTFFLAALVVIFAVSWKLAGQGLTPGGTVTKPPSSVEKPGDIGVRGHSNVEIFTPNQPGSPEPPPRDFFNPEKSAPKVGPEPNCSGSQSQKPGC
jgi:hypothetical protein